MDFFNILNAGSGSSDSEDDIDYVPPVNIESDNSEDEVSDEELDEEPASKKVKLDNQELNNKVEPAVKQSTDDVWQSFLKGVKSAPYGKANGKQNQEASTSNESANNDKPIDGNNLADKKVPDESSAVPIKEAVPSKMESDTNVDKIVPDNPVELKDDAKEVKNNVMKDEPVDALKDEPADALKKDMKDEPVDTLKNEMKGKSADVLINRPRTGLSSFLGSIANKGKKQSVLEKSLEDWKSFKDEQGIGKDLETFNKGRSGYIERQRFLERSDIRSFENEKGLRLIGRKLPGSTGK